MGLSRAKAAPLVNPGIAYEVDYKYKVEKARILLTDDPFDLFNPLDTEDSYLVQFRCEGDTKELVIIIYIENDPLQAIQKVAEYHKIIWDGLIVLDTKKLMRNLKKKLP